MTWHAVHQWTYAQTLRYAAAIEQARVRSQQREELAAARKSSPPAVTQPRGGEAPRAGRCGGWEAAVADLWGDTSTACRVLWCESKGDPSARNASGASGLMQLMPVHAGRFAARGWSYHPDVYNGVRNLTVAHDLWLEQGWGPWSCA